MDGYATALITYSLHILVWFDSHSLDERGLIALCGMSALLITCGWLCNCQYYLSSEILEKQKSALTSVLAVQKRSTSLFSILIFSCEFKFS